jgi:hypothetical protein
VPGQALAWSGRGRGLDVTVVASRFAPAAKLDRIRALDARLELRQQCRHRRLSPLGRADEFITLSGEGEADGSLLSSCV